MAEKAKKTVEDSSIESEINQNTTPATGSESNKEQPAGHHQAEQRGAGPVRCYQSPARSIIRGERRS
jgi:hypothetical protein